MKKNLSVIVCVYAILILCAVGSFAETIKYKNMEEYIKARKAAAHRQRRVIMDDDGGGAVYSLREATAKALLEQRSTTEFKGAGVDTISYCTWSSGFGKFSHRTKYGDNITATNATDEDTLRGGRGYSWNKIPEFLAQGTDPLKIMTDYCRENKIEILWNMRVNDTHDSCGYWYGPPCVSKIKKEHPEWLFGTRENPPPKTGLWSGVNYAIPEVRDLAYKFVEEVCQNYDVDGYILDFWRHPILFKSHAYGKDVSQEEMDMLTDLMIRLRDMSNNEGLKRGRPFVVGVRVPDSVEACRSIGIDLERWLKEELVDIIIVTDYYQFNKWEYSVELGHKYDVPVYACLSEPRIADKQANEIRDTKECYKGRALNAWDAGCDGVMIFNRVRPAFYCLGNPLALQAMDKVYTTGDRGDFGKYGFDYYFIDAVKRFLKLRLLIPDNAVTLKKDTSESFDVRIGDDIRGNKRKDLVATVQLQVRVRGLDDANNIKTNFNGNELTGGKIDGIWLNYDIDPKILVKGYNKIAFMLFKESNKPVVLEDLLVWVRY
jgi:hypothetical protein